MQDQPNAAVAAAAAVTAVTAVAAASDPAQALPPEVFGCIFQWLEPQELCRAACVSRRWAAVGNDPRRWMRLCDRLWRSKVYVPATLRELCAAGRAKEAYWLSLRDAKRTALTRDEICDFTWHFRFKLAAGRHYTLRDPYWLGRPPRRVRFLPSGDMDGLEDARWRFVPTACGRRGPLGSFVRLNWYPAYSVSRHSNWGFIMESCWVAITSFPPSRDDPEMQDQNMAVTVDDQRFEVFLFNNHIQYPDDLVLGDTSLEQNDGAESALSFANDVGSPVVVDPLVDGDDEDGDEDADDFETDSDLGDDGGNDSQDDGEHDGPSTNAGMEYAWSP